MGNQKNSKKVKPALKAGRPPTVKVTKKKSSKATQKTIVAFHQLNKDLAVAKSNGDARKASSIEDKMKALGGLKAYQAASIQGQSADRGGDTSILLMKWLEPVKPDLNSMNKKFKMLEVGALSTKNACSKSGTFEVEHIDLNSQAKEILKQDFMERPLPRPAVKASDEKFDMISLSLVLNFVPSASGRGEMLRRTTKFLRQRQIEESSDSDETSSSPSSASSDTFSSSPIRTKAKRSEFWFSQTAPAALKDYSATLFLVLPASCVLNSRYFNDERLTLIMASLGYCMLQRKATRKLVYYLWQLRDKPAPMQEQNFGKVKVRDGGGMNNFWVELKPEEA